MQSQEYGRTSVALISSISLPDGTSYAFTYEQTPGSCTPLGRHIFNELCHRKNCRGHVADRRIYWLFLYRGAEQYRNFQRWINIWARPNIEPGRKLDLCTGKRRRHTWTRIDLVNHNYRPRQ